MVETSSALWENASMRVLLVEDQEKTASFIRKGLVAEGFAVDLAPDGETALALAVAANFDAIVLDIMLPGRDGLSVLRLLRERRVTTPVLLLSARGEVSERIEGLNAGADDYLPKPFVLAELIARVRALGRRGGETKPVLLQLGDLKLDTVTRQAWRGDQVIELSTREYRLLEHFLKAPGRICSRMELLESVWDYTFDPGTNVVDVYVGRLRDKIDDGHEPKLLQTIRGYGYVLRKPA
jgi:DNA-binding response OmpR family regulator